MGLLVIYRAIGLVLVLRMYCPVNDRHFEAAFKLILPTSLLLSVQFLLEKHELFQSCLLHSLLVIQCLGLFS